MNELQLSRLNTLVVLLATGLVAGHLFSPVRGVSPLWGRVVLFAALMAAVGALRGWREAVLREPPSARPGALAALFAAGSVLLSALGYAAFHGWPW